MAAVLVNQSGLPHAWFEKAAPDGAVFNVLAVRGTFDFSEGGNVLRCSETQVPPFWGDEYAGPVQNAPLRAVIRQLGDLVLFKPCTDILLTGTARTEGDMPRRSWLAGIAIGSIHKILCLHGPRRFERSFMGWRLTPSETTTEVPLDYRKAFGGSYFASATVELPEGNVYSEENPAGTGWLPYPQDYKGVSRRARRLIKSYIATLRKLDAPQIDHPERPITSPFQRTAVEGFGPLPRWYRARWRYAGTYDRAWQDSRYPLLPKDFDFRFYQTAHPDLVFPGYLKGNEMIALLGLLPDGDRRMRLPNIAIKAALQRDSGRLQVRFLSLDTVTIDLDRQTVTLVWRAAFEAEDAIRDVVIRATPDTVQSDASMLEKVSHG